MASFPARSQQEMADSGRSAMGLEVAEADIKAMNGAVRFRLGEPDACGPRAPPAYRRRGRAGAAGGTYTSDPSMVKAGCGASCRHPPGSHQRRIRLSTRRAAGLRRLRGTHDRKARPSLRGRSDAAPRSGLPEIIWSFHTEHRGPRCPSWGRSSESMHCNPHQSDHVDDPGRFHI